jgi:hypothetical protein
MDNPAGRLSEFVKYVRPYLRGDHLARTTSENPFTGHAGLDGMQRIMATWVKG